MNQIESGREVEAMKRGVRVCEGTYAKSSAKVAHIGLVDGVYRSEGLLEARVVAVLDARLDAGHALVPPRKERLQIARSLCVTTVVS